MAIRITCITKSDGYHENPFTAIQSLGWVDDTTGEIGNTDRIRMYDWIKDQKGVAYVLSGNDKAYLTTAITDHGTKYVKTIADDTTRDNLLKLPEC
jgi:hypothetical protein